MFAVDVTGAGIPTAPFWWLLVTYGWPLAQLSAILALVVVVSAALPGRTAPASGRRARS